MKFLMLDLDGVVNSHDYWFRRGKKQRSEDEKSIVMGGVDPFAIRRLNEIVDKTGAAIVIISTIRKYKTFDQLKNHLFAKGFVGKIVGVTPDLNQNRCRGREIALWLKGYGYNSKFDSFVILDDGTDMEPYMDRLVKTEVETGLLDSHVERICELFGGGNK